MNTSSVRSVARPVSSLLLALIASSILLPPARADFNYALSFDSADPDPNFLPRTVGPDLATHTDVGLSVTIANGALRLFRNAGSGNGSAGYNSTFRLLSDFEVEVRGSRPALGIAESGLVGNSDLGFFDSFFASANGANAVIVIDGAPTQSIGTPNATSTGTFRLRRVGTTLFAEFQNNSSGPFATLLNFSDPNYGGPFGVGMFLLQVHGDSGSNEAIFDDMQIHSAGVAPVLHIERLGADVALSWPKGALDLALQSGNFLPADGSWTFVASTPQTIGQQSVVTLPISESPRFFRLAPKPN